jgi:hypothetical protein
MLVAGALSVGWVLFARSGRVDRWIVLNTVRT